MTRWPTKATRTGVLVRRARQRHGNCRHCPLSPTKLKTAVEFQEHNGNHRWSRSTQIFLDKAVPRRVIPSSFATCSYLCPSVVSTAFLGSVIPEGVLNLERWRDLLAFGRQRVYLPHNFHAANHAAKRGKTLTVRVAPPAKVQVRLIADADGETVLSRIGTVARHGQGAIEMLEARVARPFQGNRG